MNDLEARIRELERDNSALRNELEIQAVQFRAEVKLLRHELTETRETLASLNKVLGRLAWIITGGFISSIVAWIVGGGLVK